MSTDPAANSTPPDVTRSASDSLSGPASANSTTPPALQPSMKGLSWPPSWMNWQGLPAGSGTRGQGVITRSRWSAVQGGLLGVDDRWRGRWAWGKVGSARGPGAVRGKMEWREGVRGRRMRFRPHLC